MSLSFHIGCLPNRPLADSIEMGCAAEQMGYGGMWVADSPSLMRDPYTVLTVLAARTKSLQLATGVTLTGTRHPAVLANSWASLDELSGGRAICGIGVGESAVYNLGMKPERLAVFEEKIKVVKARLRGEKVHYEGSEIQMPWSNCEVPIVVASSWPGQFLSQKFILRSETRGAGSSKQVPSRLSETPGTYTDVAARSTQHSSSKRATTGRGMAFFGGQRKTP